MIVSNLAKALRDHAADVLKEFRLPVKNGEPRSPNIFNGYLPPKRSGNNDDFPFVTVTLDSGEIAQSHSEIKVSFIIGCYTQEYDGHEYCLNVYERLVRSLCSLPGGLLDGRYILHLPIRWELLQEQPYPQWQMIIETEWSYEAPHQEYLEEI